MALKTDSAAQVHEAAIEERREPGRLKAGIGVAVAGVAGLAALLGNVRSIKEFVYPTPSLDGRWQIEDTVRASSLASFQGLKLTYDVNVLQTGDTFQGSGEKTRENGKFVPTKCRPTLTLSGRFLSGDEVTGTYVNGVRPGCPGRQTGGTFDWKLASHGILRRQGYELRGKFAGDAAETEGDSVVSRVPGS